MARWWELAGPWGRGGLQLCHLPAMIPGQSLHFSGSQFFCLPARGLLGVLKYKNRAHAPACSGDLSLLSLLSSENKAHALVSAEKAARVFSTSRNQTLTPMTSPRQGALASQTGTQPHPPGKFNYGLIWVGLASPMVLHQR